MKRTADIIIGGKTLNLKFDMQTWELIEEQVCLIEEIGRRMAQKGRLRVVAQLVALLAHDPEVSADWVFDHMQPIDLKNCNTAINQAIALAMKMDQADDPGAPRDVILDEIEKKETPEA